jgi:hypothetical protein
MGEESINTAHCEYCEEPIGKYSLNCQKCGAEKGVLDFSKILSEARLRGRNCLGELYKLYSEQELKTPRLEMIAKNVPKGDVASANYYGAILNKHGKVEFGMWNHYFSGQLDSSTRNFYRYYLREMYVRGKAYFYGKKLINEKVLKFSKWKPRLLAALDEDEWSLITHYSRQIYEEILEEHKGDKFTINKDTPMNNRQRIAILSGLALLFLMILLPPWSNSTGAFRGYGLLFYPPAPAYVVDTTRLILQSILVMILTAGLVFVFQGSKRSREQEKQS